MIRRVTYENVIVEEFIAATTWPPIHNKADINVITYVKRNYLLQKINLILREPVYLHPIRWKALSNWYANCNSLVNVTTEWARRSLRTHTVLWRLYINNEWTVLSERKYDITCNPHKTYTKIMISCYQTNWYRCSYLREITTVVPWKIIQNFHITFLKLSSESCSTARVFLPRLTFNIVRPFRRRFLFMIRAIDAFSYLFLMTKAKFSDECGKE